MLKRITLAAAALAIGLPGLAAPKYLDDSHQRLWDSLEASGVSAHVNPREVCGNPRVNVMGLYTYNPHMNRSLMAICQDFRNQNTLEETVWTNNDLDTLRHESIHYLQDCLDGNKDLTLSPIFDGPGGLSPVDGDYSDVLDGLGREAANRIAYRYQRRGADSRTIRLEHEAFYLASEVPAEDIAATIDLACKPR